MHVLQTSDLTYIRHVTLTSNLFFFSFCGLLCLYYHCFSFLIGYLDRVAADERKLKEVTYNRSIWEPLASLSKPHGANSPCELSLKC